MTFRQCLGRRLACAVAGAAIAAFGFASTASAHVAVFDNGDYVDTANDDPGSESDNVQATLDELKVPFRTFTAITAAESAAAIAGSDAVLIPEQEEGRITADPDAEGLVTSLKDYVEAGGKLIVHYDESLIDAIAGTALSMMSLSRDAVITADANGTPFAAGPASLPDNDATDGLEEASLPSGAKAIYSDGSAAPVVVIPVGAGSIVYMGWDWYDAKPIGSQDGGWVEVLRLALNGKPRTVSVADASMLEGNVGATGMPFKVTLSAPAALNPVTVRFATAPGTAGSDDFWSISETVTFQPGETTKTVIVPIIGDTVVEPDETFTATLSAASGAVIARAKATGTILNDDVATPPTPPTYRPQLAPKSFTAAVAARRDKRAPYRFVVRGKVALPAGVKASDGCGGFVAVRVTKGKKTVQTVLARVNKKCAYRVAVQVPRKGRYRASVEFLGNRALKPAKRSAGNLRAG